MKRIKVLITGSFQLNPRCNGVKMETFYGKFADYLSYRDDIELYMVTIGDENKLLEKDNLSFYMIKRRNIRFYTLILTWLLMRRIKDIRPDIICAYETLAPCSTVVALLRSDYPTVLMPITVPALESNYTTMTKISTLNARYVFSKIPNIVIPSSVLKNLLDGMTKSEIYVVPFGIEYERIEKIEPHNISENPDIFFVGRLEKVKGIDILLSAIPKIKDSIPNLSVYIAGVGSQEDELKRLAKNLHIGMQVKFLGFITEQEKFEYYKACKIVAVPSRWDFSPVTIYEAMACGKPVVASKVGGIPGLVDNGKTGLFFESGDVEDISAKIIQLLRDKRLREEMGKAAKDKAKRYDWRKIAERTVEIYKEIIANFHERKAKNKKSRKGS